MASSINFPKNLEESKNFEGAKKKITPNAKRFDEIIIGISFVIAKSPGEFPEIDNTGIRIAKTRETPDNPPLTIYFKEYDEKIVFLDVEITPEENQSA